MTAATPAGRQSTANWPQRSGARQRRIGPTQANSRDKPRNQEARRHTAGLLIGRLLENASGAELRLSTNAARAGVQPDDLIADLDPVLLYVRHPGTSGLPVGMAHIVTRNRVLPTEVAANCQAKDPLLRVPQSGIIVGACRSNGPKDDSTRAFTPQTEGSRLCVGAPGSCDEDAGRATTREHRADRRIWPASGPRSH